MLQSVRWSDAQKQEFRSWFQSELENTFSDRVDLERRWANLIVQWRCSLPEGTKEFPWTGASNVPFPLTAIHADPVYADMMQSFHASENFYTPTAKRSDRVPEVNSLREGLTALDRTYLNIRKVNKRAFLDQIILGTAIYKVHRKRARNRRPRYAPDGTVDRIATLESFPVYEHIPLQYFYLPAYAWDIDPDAPVGGSPWVSQKFYLTRDELKLRASEDPSTPSYDRTETDKVLEYETDPNDLIDLEIRHSDRFTPFRNRKIELHEVWVRFDASGEGFQEDIQVIWHQPTLSVLRAIYYPFDHNQRPFHKTEYFPSLGFYGIGIADTDEWAQQTVSKLLNAQIDNLMVVNTRMYSAPLGSMIQPGEPIYPGKIWPVGPDEQVREIRLGDIYPSLPATMSQFLQWAEMRTGVSELRQGNIQGLPSRTPATTILSVLREGNKRFDMIHSNTRSVFAEMGWQLVRNLAQDIRTDPSRWLGFFRDALGPEDAANIFSILSDSPDTFDATFGVDVSATSAQVNKEAEKQSFIGLLQIVTQSYSQMVQTAMLMQQLPPGSPAHETAAASYAAGVQLLQRLYERFDIQNPSEYLGNMEAISASLTSQGQGQNAATAGLIGPMGNGGGQMGPGGVPVAPFPATGGLGFPTPDQLGGLFGGF